MEHLKKNALILIIDDDIITCKALSKVLLSKEYDVIHALNGQDGLKQIENNQVDLVILDSEMPIMNGDEVLKQLRANPQYQFLPVIMVTAVDSEENVLKMLDLGANDYLTKPVRVPVLLARMSRFLNVVDKIQADRVTKELNTIKAIIGTYNHEINNPLASAIGFLQMEIEKLGGENKNLNRVLTSLQRISEVVKKMHQLSKGNVQYEKYTEHSKIIKIS